MLTAATSSLAGIRSVDVDVPEPVMTALASLIATPHQKRFTSRAGELRRCSRIESAGKGWTYFCWHPIAHRPRLFRLSSDGELCEGPLGLATDPHLDALLTIYASRPREPNLNCLIASLQHDYAERRSLTTSAWVRREPIDCPACSSRSMVREAGATVLSECIKCGLLYRTVSKAAWTEMMQMYADPGGRYFDRGVDGSLSTGHGYESYEEWFEVLTGGTRLRRKLRRLIREAALPKGPLIDVGAGGGYSVAALQQLGVDARGIEPSAHCRRRAVDKFGLHFFPGTLEQAGFDDGSIAALSYFDVWEHLPDPVRELEEARRVLRPRGRLILELPNQGSAIATILGRDYLFAEHLAFYERSTIIGLLTANGFEVRASYTLHDEYYCVQRFMSASQSRALLQRYGGERLIIIAAKVLEA